MKNMGNYDTAIIKLIPWIREQISKSPYNIFRTKVKDIKKEMGSEFEKLSDIELYRCLKSVLYKYGIGLETSRTKDDEIVLW